MAHDEVNAQDEGYTFPPAPFIAGWLSGLKREIADLDIISGSNPLPASNLCREGQYPEESHKLFLVRATRASATISQ